ncbi:5'-methylthioadenosine phosphorylase [Methylophaga frappieri]|uniref:Probable S-methyl-5'-thioinosine phosphorylase n=1 Tax=Methylophaga frappieri (strain ATCC BAA-2434 / DSM 25690 / JAM7) TaxID=754477 RepID=I1YFW4_METFJ|nr:S-methyl-5'-thioinosine phosphorylase [Methylophaga frappieri]AFJ01807.1 5'-methylthioadenosine phosphorylase [Methylophaga frappieri]
MMGVIGGSGLSRLSSLKIDEQIQLDTPFGEPSAPLFRGWIDKKPLIFLPRHGEYHTIPPHLINYRANLWAMHHLGVRQVLAVAAVGGINPELAPGSLAVPDQIIDYTWGRESSIYTAHFSADKHIDFTHPYDAVLRGRLLTTAQTSQIKLVDGGAYAVTQGPRLETAAEIKRLARDGADMVGMTAMPEAAIARELEMAYVTLAIVANHAAGLSDKLITVAEIQQTTTDAMTQVYRVIQGLLTGT